MSEKLIELLEEYIEVVVDLTGEPTIEVNYGECAAELIANGVTVREKGEWLVGMIKPWNMEVGNWKCSVCKGVSLQAKNFCPNCGADMRGEK